MVLPEGVTKYDRDRINLGSTIRPLTHLKNLSQPKAIAGICAVAASRPVYHEVIDNKNNVRESDPTNEPYS